MTRGGLFVVLEHALRDTHSIQSVRKDGNVCFDDLGMQWFVIKWDLSSAVHLTPRRFLSNTNPQV